MVIGISGIAGSGKDTVGEIIQRIAVRPWIIKKYADKLKEIASILLGVPRDMFEDQNFKNSYLGKEWSVDRGPNLLDGPKGKDAKYDRRTGPLTVREFLVRLGTEAARYGLHPNTWENALFVDYILQVRSVTREELRTMGHIPSAHAIVHGVPDYPNWIITDVRFPNEAQAIKDRGGKIIRVEREDNPYPRINHISETALDDWKFDYTIHNDRGIDELVDVVERVYNEIIHEDAQHF